MDSEENSGNLYETDEESDIECEACEKTFSNAQTYQQHLHTKKHYKMLMKTKLMQRFPDAVDTTSHNPTDEEGCSPFPNKELHCKTCHKYFSGFESYETHVNSTVHAKNVRKQKLTAHMKDMPEVLTYENEEDEITDPKPFARCPTCEKSFSGPESLRQHMMSEVHIKKMKMKKLIESRKSLSENAIDNGEEFYVKCDTCNKSFSGIVPYEIHMKSVIHNRELQKAEAENDIKDSCFKDPETKQFICKECKKSFTDPFALKSHLKNNSHEKQKAKKEMFDFVASNPEIVAGKSVMDSSDEVVDADETSFPRGFYFLVCKICHLSLTGPESARDHVKSKKHTKILEEKKGMKLLKDNMKTSNPNGDKGGSKIEMKLSDSDSVHVSQANPGFHSTTRGKKENDDDFELL